MKYIFHCISFSAALLLSYSPARAASTSPRPAQSDANWVASQGIPLQGKLIMAQRVTDDEGHHVLVLTRQAGPSPSNPRSNRAEKIDLLATFYREVSPSRWEQEWTIRDGVDCPNLDSSADFFPSQVTFTDLNSDRRVEVTVPYHMFCGGGVDSHTVKVILREGQTKLAVRGESRVSFPGMQPFGGDHKFDDVLNTPARATYKRHLQQVWDKVSDDKRL